MCVTRYHFDSLVQCVCGCINVVLILSVICGLQLQMYIMEFITYEIMNIKTKWNLV